MRKTFAILTIIGLAGCEVPAPEAPQDTRPAEPVATTPFTWKGNTPRNVRAFDINECELAGRGLPIDATPEQIEAASAVSNPDDVAAFVQRCLANKGYVQTSLPVCTSQDYLDGEFLQAPEVLPALERIRCLDPVARGMIVTA
ncbi:MAG: hypothetical protein AAFR93_11800 [Pseudomonadota bacterium]